MARIVCSYCGAVTETTINVGVVRVAQHNDVYPTRICEGSGRQAKVLHGEWVVVTEARPCQS